MLFRSWGFVCLLIVCLAAGIAINLLPASGKDSPTDVLQQSEWEARIEATLDAKGDWAFEDVPLNEVCAAIQEKLGIDVVLDVKALEDFGIDTGTPITKSLQGISNRSFLRLMLRDVELTYTMQLGALWITTSARAESLLAIKVYPVGDLLSGDTRYGQIVQGYSLLEVAIRSNIAPDTWGQLGGPGAIERFHNSLVVGQTSGVQEQVEQFLSTYRTIIANDPGASEPKQTAFMLGMDANSTIGAALDKPLTAEFEDASLRDVVEAIARAMEIPVVIDVTALEDFGIDTSTPVSQTFNRTPLRFALARLLYELELTYVIRDEVLVITTPEQSEAQLEIGLYPVRDLVDPGNESLDLPLGARCDFDTLTNLIQSTVAPDTWDAVGGPSSIGPLLPVPTIVIAQTQDAHEQIIELLANLRAAKKLEAVRPVANAEVDPTALVIRTYPLYVAYNGPDVIVNLIVRASEPGTWDDEAGTFVQGLGTSIVVKHNASGHAQVQKLLAQLGFWSPVRRSGKQLQRGGGGFGGGEVPIPAPTPGATGSPAGGDSSGGFF